MEAVMEATEVCLGDVESVPLGEGRAFCVNGLSVAVFRPRDGSLYAVQAECPHQGGPLAEGIVGGCSVICPLHSWKFDLATGACTQDPSQRLRTFPIRQAGGRLLLTIV